MSEEKKNQTENTSLSDSEKEESLKNDIWDFLKTLLISMVVVFLVAHFVFRPIRIDGNSMYPTLHGNSIGVSNTIGYKVGGIDRFDIAIIYLPEKNEYLVKRVIGLPGETVEYKDDKLYIDGQYLEESFLNSDYKDLYGNEFTDDFGPVTLKEGEYFCLGDNRPNSRDSRYYGPFQKNQIISKGAFIFFPFTQFGVKTW